MKPEVTIGICARNSETTICTTIESVVKQKFPHDLMEIIFVDDGSSDSTLKIMQAYASRIDIPTTVLAGKWQGLGKSRNKIINNAQGDCVIWLDSDETIEENFVQKQWNLMKKFPKAGIVTAKMELHQEENLILLLDLIPQVVESSRQDWKGRSNLPGTGAATYRVEAAIKSGGFDECLEIAGEDIEIAKRIRQAGWLVLRGDGIFYESHGHLANWRDLWKRYFNQGRHLRRLYNRSNYFFSLYRMNPVASFIVAFSYTVLGYQKTKLKVVFLLPFHFTFKMFAWFLGFNKGS